MHISQHVPSIATATSHLLTATKSMLQTLNLWSEKKADVSDVSHKFVKFGDAFKTLKKSYIHLGVDISDLLDVPLMIRKILETSLTLEPSTQSLDTFLPQIGDAIAKLMKMLKEKQSEVTRLETAKRNPSSSTSSSVTSFKTADISTISNISNTSMNFPLDINRTPSKDAITRLQNNTDLKRRASKRYSAYQTSSIISMKSPKSGSIFNQSDVPKTPLYNDLSPDITAEDLESAKNSSNLFDIEEAITPETEDANFVEITQNIAKNEIIEDPVRETAIQNTTNALTGGARSTSMVFKKQPFKKNESEEIFVKFKDQVKKVHIKLPTTIANLKVLFTQKFNYSPPGISAFPKFNIQNDISKIAYELENVEDIKYGAIISLQQPDLQTSIFKYMDSQMNDIKNDMMNMEDRIYKKFEQIQFNQQSITSISQPTRNSVEVDYEKELKKKIEQTQEQQKLIDELSDQVKKVKQHQLRTSKRLTDIVNGTVDCIVKFQDSGLVPANVSENSYVKDCKTKVSEGCESLVEKLDDLQDVIEFMKRDITKHNIKPSEKQIDHLFKEMKKTKQDLNKFTEFTKIERKNLSTIWTKQMATIAADQRFFKAQEEIIGLLEQDYQSAQETFDLIVSCSKQLEKGSLAYKTKLPVPDPTISPWDASKLVMAEVDGIVPNHEERVEAILKAERVREMEKELRLKDEFKEELDEFVSNEKLKKGTMSISELEKLRQEKDMEHFKNTMGVI